MFSSALLALAAVLDLRFLDGLPLHVARAIGATTYLGTCCQPLLFKQSMYTPAI
jgi:hypothetical protein